MGRYLQAAVVLIALLGGRASADVVIWQFDPLHSAAYFSVRHMMITTVRGQFGNLKGRVQLDNDDITKSSVEATIDSRTINSGDPKRDSDLRGEEFFHIEKYPTMTFRSKRVERSGPERLRVIGDLTVRNVTREVILDIDGPTAPISDKGVLRRGVTATTKINRREFGIVWNRILDSGGVAVGDDVSIELSVELVRR